MGLTVEVPTRVIRYTRDQFDRWKSGDRTDCPDPYCRKLPGAMGFGENLVGQHFAAQGYRWIHHDYNIFGGNKPGKWPTADEVLRKGFGSERFEKARHFYPAFKPLEEPDLLIYRPDFSEVRFAETKRFGTSDRLRISQIKGLALIALLFDCPAEAFLVVEEDKNCAAGPARWEF